MRSWVFVLALVAAPAAAQTQPSEPPAPKTNEWYQWENRAFTSQLTLSALFDIAAFVQDDANTTQVGDQPVKATWRAERILLNGTLNFARPWTYLLGMNFNGIESELGEYFSWMDLRVDIPFARGGRVKIGQQKVGVSQEWMMPGLDWILMERSTMNNSFVPQRNVGIQVTNNFARERGLWSAGWFNDWFVDGRSLSDGGNQYSARVSLLPIDRNEGATLLQVAAAAFYKQGIDGMMQFRSRPEVNLSDYFIDTGSFAADHSLTSQFEMMAITGPAQVFGELSLTPVSAPDAGNPFFYGGYAGASYFLTGEHRSFNRRDGYYGPFTPKSPFSLKNGGRGAWEVSGRWSRTDLADGTIDGGTLSLWTTALAWYPTRHWRFEVNYGYGSLDRNATTGRFHSFQNRIQWSM